MRAPPRTGVPGESRVHGGASARTSPTAERGIRRRGHFATYAIALLPGGRPVDRFGHGQVALAGLTVFRAGTLPGALAESFGLRAGSRVVQGAGAGLASPAALVGAVSGFPAERRGTAHGTRHTAMFAEPLRCRLRSGPVPLPRRPVRHGLRTRQFSHTPRFK